MQRVTASWDIAPSLPQMSVYPVNPLIDVQVTIHPSTRTRMPVYGGFTSSQTETR